MRIFNIQKLHSFIVTASLLTASIGTTAMAVPLSSLLGGETLTAGDVTFSDFTFSEFGYDGDAGDIDVTTFVGPTSVTLEFDFLLSLWLPHRTPCHKLAAHSPQPSGGLISSLPSRL